jgi:hypothetical protein
MTSARRNVTIAVGVVVLVFGLLCLNYTKAVAWDHHTRQAERYHLPPPSQGILYLGAATIAAGAGAVGFGVGRRPA